MKLIPAAALAAAAGLAWTAVAPPAAAQVRIFACEPEWAALAEEIAGEDADVWSATHGREDAHYVRARPSLLARVRRADMLICAGADLEVGWLPVLLQRGAPAGVQPGRTGHLMAADHVGVLDRPETLDRAQGDLHPGGNPHVHLDPRNIPLIAAELTARLARIDPAGAEGYRARLAAFRDRWAAALAGWSARAARLAGMTAVVHHEAWIYLFDWAGLVRAAALEPLPSVPPTPGHLRTVLQRMEQSPADVIVRSPLAPTDAAEWLSGKTGIPIVELPFTVGGSEEASDLFSLFDSTLALLEGVSGSP